MPAREPDCGHGRGPSVAQGKRYGVRSYLHLFYEDCSGASPDRDGDRDGSSPHAAWAPPIWQVSLCTGTPLLLVGAAALAAGSPVPPKLEGIGEEESVVPDVQAAWYNHALGTLAGPGSVPAWPGKAAVCSPWARPRWLWAQHSSGGGAGREPSFPDTSFHQTSPLPAREGRGDREGPSSGFRGKSAVQTWVPTP
ncbi:NRSN2 protein, partial [Mesembrinibis cayennensis]|nr:NRSN2 protein [Mesembrinibis cayennensis]